MPKPNRVRPVPELRVLRNYALITGHVAAGRLSPQAVCMVLSLVRRGAISVDLEGAINVRGPRHFVDASTASLGVVEYMGQLLHASARRHINPAFVHYAVRGLEGRRFTSDIVRDELLEYTLPPLPGEWPPHFASAYHEPERRADTLGFARKAGVLLTRLGAAQSDVFLAADTLQALLTVRPSLLVPTHGAGPYVTFVMPTRLDPARLRPRGARAERVLHRRYCYSAVRRLAAVGDRLAVGSLDPQLVNYVLGSLLAQRVSVHVWPSVIMVNVRGTLGKDPPLPPGR